MKTSNVPGAGTDANVYVILFGLNGDTGELHLKKSETNKSPFENDQLDVFSFKEMLSTGEMSKCRVWHDNKGKPVLFGGSWSLGTYCFWTVSLLYICLSITLIMAIIFELYGCVS